MSGIPESAGKWGWLVPVVRFPVTRIVLALAALVAASFVWRRAFLALEDLILGREAETTWLYQITLVLVYHFIYVGYVRLVERRPARELAWGGAVAELGKGMLIGAAFLAVVVGLVAALGFYRVVAVNPWSALLAPLAIAVMSGYTEELMFRGVLLRIAEESLGTWLALLISSALFRGRPCGQPRCDRRQHRGDLPGGRRAARGSLRPHAAAVDGNRHPLRVELHAGRHLRGERLRERRGRTARVAVERPGVDLRRELRRGGFPLRGCHRACDRRRLSGAGTPARPLHEAFLEQREDVIAQHNP